MVMDSERSEVTIEPTRGLSDAALEEISALAQRVVDHDGGRLKLEFGELRRRAGERAEDVLAWSDGRLIGFAGLYGPIPSSIEIAGMVDPEYRRRKIGTRLLDAALALCAPLDVHDPLLIVPRGSEGGRALAQGRGAPLDHSEHALVLRGDPIDGPADPRMSMRTAQTDDIADLLRILSSGFGAAPNDLAGRLVEPDARTLMIERDGVAVGTMRVTRDGDIGGVYGFAIEPRYQRQGIGRDALRRACRQLRADGATVVNLEVEVDNDSALALYTSLGFEAVVTEDYWTLAA
jgi:ribosomal protein S18 acetylase RimI-like enzyme